MERLADRAHHLKPITAYKDGLAQLTKWETDMKEFAKIEEQNISDLTKRTMLKAMIPPDLVRDFDLAEFMDFIKLILLNVVDFVRRVRFSCFV